MLVKLFANAVSAGVPLGPIIKSMWATSFPSPTSDSPTSIFVIFAIFPPFRDYYNFNINYYNENLNISLILSISKVVTVKSAQVPGLKWNFFK